MKKKKTSGVAKEGVHPESNDEVRRFIKKSEKGFEGEKHILRKIIVVKLKNRITGKRKIIIIIKSILPR